MNSRDWIVLLAALVSATPLIAQPRGTGDPGTFRSEIRVQGYVFDNFFHSTRSDQEQDITALGTEYRAAYRAKERPAELFAHVSLIGYNDDDLEASYGGRLGLRYNGLVNDVRVYVDRTLNRPSFEVGNVFAPADTTTLAGEHSLRLSDDWQIGALLRHQRQRFDSPRQTPASLSRDNEFNSVGGRVRYRGLGWRYTPQIGFNTGNRNVSNAEESYDDRSWYLQMEAIPLDRLYVSARFTDRSRDYEIGDPRSSNFRRKENRGEWELVIDYKTAGRLGYTLYYANEGVDSSRVGGDFDVQLLIFGVSIGL